VQKPNLTKPSVTISNLGAFNSSTATYGSVDVYFSTNNDGGSGTTAAASYLVEPVAKTAISGSIPSGLAPGPTGYNRTVTVPGPIAFGAFTVKVSVDTPIATNGSIDEVTEGVADNTNTVTLTVPPPDPGLTFAVDKQRVRQGETANLTWSVSTPYPGLSCIVTGPNVNYTGMSGTNQPTAAIQAKSVYTLECTEATTNTKFTKIATVEVEGKIEEI
jgi:hypothetical protein